MVVSLRLLTALSTALIIFVFFMFFSTVSADKGGFSPIREHVFESGQKALVAWNGTHEVLVLSTDVSSSQETKVVELLPLPSNPTISKGQKQSFLKAKQLVNTYLAVMRQRLFPRIDSENFQSSSDSPPKIRITFQDIIGVHYLTVVEVEEANELILWLQDFLKDEGYAGELPSNLEELSSYYIKNEINFFVIDIIETNSTIKSVDPLIYEFRSSHLYYPLRISSLFSGETEISLLTITNNELNNRAILRQGFSKKAQFQIKQEALLEISANITKLFSSDMLHTCYFEFKGSLESFHSDILAKFVLVPSFDALTFLGLSLGLGVMVLFFFVERSGIVRLHIRNIHTPISKRLATISLFVGLAGIFLILGGPFLPWGLTESGTNEEVLVSITGLDAVIRLPETSVIPTGILFPFSILAFLILIIGYGSLLVEGGSKGISIILAGGGMSLVFLVLITCSFLPYITNVGVYITLTGCSFTVLAGLLSFFGYKTANQ